MQKNAELDQKGDQKNEAADITMNENGVLNIFIQPENQYATTSKTKVLSGKFADRNIENNRKLNKLRNQIHR